MEPLPLSLKEKLFTTTMLLYGIVTASCGRNEPIEPEPLPRSDYQQIRDRYAALSYESGWPSLNDCDAALWAGLAATGYPVDLSLAFDEGKPYRRPSHDCYQQGNSHSTTSNDQITGLLWGIWVTQDKDLFSKFLKYAEDNDYVVGEPDTAIGSVILKPNVRALIGLMSWKFGLGSTAWGSIRIMYLHSDVDYVRHIQILQILLYGALTGYVTSTEANLLCRYKGDYLAEAACSLYNGDTNLRGLVGREPPTYVRGKDREAFELAHKLFTIGVINGFSQENH